MEINLEMAKERLETLSIYSAIHFYESHPMINKYNVSLQENISDLQKMSVSEHKSISSVIKPISQASGNKYFSGNETFSTVVSPSRNNIFSYKFMV